MNIVYIITGVVAFCLFLVYDINSIKGNSKILKSMFLTGVLILAAATGLLLSSEWKTGSFSVIRTAGFMIVALVFLILLVYTLFFALPFTETYISDSGKPKVCMTGVYGMCRHPGFLWFLGMYACFALAIPTSAVIWGSAIFCLCNLVYIIVQDKWTFPNFFDDYNHYKEVVPFLIPNRNSIREGIRTL